MTEELFQGLWDRVLLADGLVSEEAVPTRASGFEVMDYLGGLEVMDYLDGNQLRPPLHLLAVRQTEAADMSLGLQADLTRVAGGIGSSEPDVLWDFCNGGLFL